MSDAIYDPFVFDESSKLTHDLVKLSATLPRRGDPVPRYLDIVAQAYQALLIHALRSGEDVDEVLDHFRSSGQQIGRALADEMMDMNVDDDDHVIERRPRARRRC